MLHLNASFFPLCNPLTPVPAVTTLVLSSTFDVVTFDQIRHHLYSTSAGGKDLSNISQIRVIGRMDPEICTKMLKKLSEKQLSKISCHCTCLLHGKSCPSQCRFLRSFFISVHARSKLS